MTGPTPSTTGEIAADAIELTQLAATYLDCSRDLTTALQALDLAIPPQSAFGRTPGAAGLHRASDAAAEQAGLAVGRLIEVLDGDVDRLYRLAFAYHEAEQQAAIPQTPRGGPQP